MTPDGPLKGIFWALDAPQSPLEGILSRDGEAWRLTVQGALIDVPAKIHFVPTGLAGGTDRLTRPTPDTATLIPQTILGEVAGVGSITLLNTTASATSFPLTLSISEGTLAPGTPISQPIHVQGILIGAHVDPSNALVHGIRLVHACGPIEGTPTRCLSDGGILSAWAHACGDGFSLTWDTPRPLTDVAELFTRRTAALVALIHGHETRYPRDVEVLINGNWHALFGPPDRNLADDGHHGLGEVTLEHVAAWLESPEAIWPIPFMVADSEELPIELQAALLTQSLEGLHRATHPDSRYMQNLSSVQRRRIRTAAVNAALVAAEEVGFDHSDGVLENRLYEALGHAGQLTYKERLTTLLSPVAEMAPELFMPGLSEWSRTAQQLRDGQSHVLPGSGLNGNDERIAHFISLATSARWALRLALLIAVLGAEDLACRLSASDEYLRALALLENQQPGSGGPWTTFTTRIREEGNGVLGE